MNRQNHKRPPARRDNHAPQAPRAKGAGSQLQARVIEAIEPVVKESGLYLESVKVGRGGQRCVVRVAVDLPAGPGGVGSDQLAEVSRAISAHLDDVDLIEGAYNLEVSTPGADRLLIEPRHFSRAQGRLIKVTPVEGKPVVARLEAVEGDILVLRGDNGTWRQPIRDIAKARVQISFDHPDDN